MATIKELAKGRRDLYQVSVHDLHVKDGWNSRDESDPANAAHIDDLARSIAREGVKEALTVYMENGTMFVEHGHMRRLGTLRAIDLYGAAPTITVPVQFGNKDATEADRVSSQIIRNSGKPFSPLEMGTVFAKLTTLGKTDKEIAEIAGVSRAYVGQLAMLMAAPKAIHDLVRSGSVSATLAIETLKDCEGDGKEAAKRLKEAVKTAKAAGKDRATKKHLTTGDPEADDGATADTPRKTRQRKTPDSILEAFLAAHADNSVNEAGQIIFVFDRDRFADFASLINFSEAALKAKAEDLI